MATPFEDPFDATDLDILAALQSDGRMPFSAIARRLGLPESTVRLRTRKILASGAIAIVATGDPLKLGIPIDAVSLVRVAAPRADAVADALEAMPEVRYVGVSLGGTTIVVESLHADADALHRFLAHRLSELEGVKEVDSHQIIENRKSVWDWQSWLRECTPVAAPQPSREDA